MSLTPVSRVNYQNITGALDCSILKASSEAYRKVRAWPGEVPE